MTTRNPIENASERSAISELLPWYAAGTLSAADKARVDAAIAADPSLADELEIIRDDQHATLQLADSAPVPSARVLDELMRKVDAEPARFAHVAARAKAGFADWLGSKLMAFQPRTLAYAAGAAALALVLQAGVIGSNYVGEGATFRTASHQTDASGQAVGTYVLVGFNNQATTADMTALLQQAQAIIVEGPRQGGVYKVRIGARGMAQADIERVVGQLRAKSDVVRFVGASN
jgi:anti-sigma factor RsiW